MFRLKKRTNIDVEEFYVDVPLKKKANIDVEWFYVGIPSKKEGKHRCRSVLRSFSPKKEVEVEGGYVSLNTLIIVMNTISPRVNSFSFTNPSFS